VGRLFLLFVLVPVVELYLLVAIGKAIGVLPTLAMLGASAIFGTMLARREGARVLRTWQAAIDRGEVPREGLVSSLLVLVGGVLLVIPGVLSDVVGVLLLIPWTRRLVAHGVRGFVERRMQVTRIHIPGYGAAAASDVGEVIDVEATERPAHDPNALVLADPSSGQDAADRVTLRD
jgi:UPF0716 protein FxsA